MLCITACALDKKISKDFKVIYEIQIDDSNQSMFPDLFLPTESVSYVKGHLSRSELNMGMGMNTSVINNSKSGETYSLMNILGKKLSLDLSETDKKDTSLMSKVILVDGSKTICGYPCKKAEIHFMLDGKPYVSSAWYTPQIKNKAITLSGKLYEELDGLLMEFDVENKGMKMRMLAKSIEFKEIDAALFQVPADYKKVSMEDLYKQFGNIH